MEKIPGTWKGLKKLEFEARRIVVKHIESLAKRAELEKEIAIIDDYPKVRLKCLLWPWLPQCPRPPFDICRRFPWLCPPFCFLPPCPIPCYLCPPRPPDWWIDPVVAIDAILYRLPDVKPEMITEDAVLNASFAVMEEGDRSHQKVPRSRLRKSEKAQVSLIWSDPQSFFLPYFCNICNIDYLSNKQSKNQLNA